MTNRLLTCIALLSAPALAEACSCVDLTTEEQFDLAEHVFVARVRALEDLAPEAVYEGQDESYRSRFDYGIRVQVVVVEEIKGHPASVPLKTGYPGGCSFGFDIGETYLVSVGDDGEASSCSLVRRFPLAGCPAQNALARLRARAFDGATPLKLPTDFSEPMDPKFVEAIVAGADPRSFPPKRCDGAE